MVFIVNRAAGLGGGSERLDFCLEKRSTTGEDLVGDLREWRAIGARGVRSRTVIVRGMDACAISETGDRWPLDIGETSHASGTRYRHSSKRSARFAAGFTLDRATAHPSPAADSPTYCVHPYVGTSIIGP